MDRRRFVNGYPRHRKLPKSFDTSTLEEMGTPLRSPRVDGIPPDGYKARLPGCIGLLEKWGQAKHSRYGCNISAFYIRRINIPFILHSGMLKYWLLRSGIDIRRMKVKSPYHVRYRLYVGLCGMEVIWTSEWSVLASGAKNITVYFKLTRLGGYFWPSWSILP